MTIRYNPLLSEDLDPDENTTVWIKEDDTNDTVPQDHARVPEQPREDNVPLPDIEIQPQGPQQAVPGVVDQQSRSPPNEVSGELSDSHGNTEHNDDTINDPNFVANNFPNTESQPQVPNQLMPTVLDQQAKSSSDKANGEVVELRGNAEHTDDTRIDPDFVPNKDTPVEDNQVRQSTRNRKAKNYRDFYLY